MRRLARRRPRSGDGGFTLIELVITITIMGIIFVPLANFFIEYLDTSNQTQQRLSDSHDLQIVAAYFSQDVANTGLRNQIPGQVAFTPQQSVWTSGISTSFCGTTIAGTPVLELAGDDESAGSGAGSDTVVSVVYSVDAGTLHRQSCSRPPTGPAILAPGTTVVHNLAATPAVQCSSTCTAATPPATVTLTLSVQAGASDSSGTSVTLTGHRRQASS